MYGLNNATHKYFPNRNYTVSITKGIYAENASTKEQLYWWALKVIFIEWVKIIKC